MSNKKDWVIKGNYIIQGMDYSNLEVRSYSAVDEEDMKKILKSFQKSVNLECECGIDKTYGRLASINMHSDYCPKSKILKYEQVKSIK